MKKKLIIIFNLIAFLSINGRTSCGPLVNNATNNTNDNPLLLLISFDGFRWDYLNTYNLTNFNRLKSMGSHADYIYNAFATITFPNHWTIGNL
jgi:predicted AlkP superfamily pyrophosphatase or phosphodiesterase